MHILLSQLIGQVILLLLDEVVVLFRKQIVLYQVLQMLKVLHLLSLLVEDAKLNRLGVELCIVIKHNTQEVFAALEGVAILAIFRG